MTEDVLDFLDEKPEAPVAEVKAPEPEAQAEAVAPAEAAEADKGEKIEVAPPAPPKEKPHDVPVTALMDEREKRQEAQRRAEAAEKRAADLERRMAEKPAPKPDFFENPEAAVAAQITSARLQQSKFFAERDFGAEMVAEAYAYFDQHPEQSQALIGEPSPFHAAVEHYKRQKVMAEIGKDPEAYIKAKVEAQLAERLAAVPKPNAPPASLSTAPSVSGETKSTGNAFDSVFG